MKRMYVLSILLFLYAVLTAECGPVLFKDNFNSGAAGWKLSGKHGEWRDKGGVDGSGALLISGDEKGKVSSSWYGPKLDFKPGGVYGIRFKLRSENASGGSVTTGTGFCNVDVGVPGTVWQEHSFCFAVPSELKDSGYVKFGIWNCSGDFFMDDLEIFEVDPVYNRNDAVRLGAGEVVDGNIYRFNSYMNGRARNHSRVLKGFSAGFNSQRWCVGRGTTVDFLHELPARQFSSMSITLNCGYYQRGSMRVLVSKDSKQWLPVGRVSSTGSSTFVVSKDQFPAAKIFVRLEGDQKECNLQIYNYGLTAEFKGDPLDMRGYTYYIEKIEQSDSLSVDVSAVDFDAEGQSGVVEMTLFNKGNKSFRSKVKLNCENDQRGKKLEFSEKVRVVSGASASVSIPFSFNSAGKWELRISAGDDYASCFNLSVPDFFDNSYGELLPVKSDALTLWQASSGWKIPKGRSLPKLKSRRMQLSLAANERESIQLVLNSAKELKNVKLSVSDFKDGRSVLPSGVVEIDKVGYVPVKQPTDGSGVVADWPDPILPQSESCELAAGINHPYWIRVSIPKGIKAGEYDGYIYVKGEGISERVRLKIKVYDFELPDRMSCETAFGMNQNRIFRYHRVKSIEDKRVVVDKYLKCLADNHISPYHPAPLDPWKVDFIGLPAWRGGSFDSENACKGKFSYRVEDNKQNGNVSATYDKIVKISGKPLKVCFSHRSDRKQRTLFTLNCYRKDGSWISGNNRDLWITSSPEWKHEEILIKRFHNETAGFKISLWGSGYHEGKGTVGTTWYDDIVITEVDDNKVVFNDGQFEAPGVVGKDVKVSFDWEAWDRQMERAFNEYHFNSFRFRVQGLGGGTFMRRSEPQLAGISEDDPVYSTLLDKYLSGVEQHLKEKGWLKDAYVYWFDEPDPKDYEFVMNGFRKLKKYAPALRRMLTEQVEPELVGGPNLWCPLTPHLNVEGTEAQRKVGDEFWWYVCCGPKAPYVTLFIDHPGAEMRLWLWQTWQERVTGILIWDTVYWHCQCAYPDSLQNPYEDSMGWSNNAEKGERKPWGNGDGRFMYPPRSVFTEDGPNTDDPVPTMRLEMLRDGLEDYEYFVILKKLLKKKGTKLSSRKLAKYESLLEVPSDVSTSLTEFNVDPSAMESHREKLARAIEELSR